MMHHHLDPILDVLPNASEELFERMEGAEAVISPSTLSYSSLCSSRSPCFVVPLVNKPTPLTISDAPDPFLPLLALTLLTILGPKIFDDEVLEEGDDDPEEAYTLAFTFKLFVSLATSFILIP